MLLCLVKVFYVQKGADMASIFDEKSVVNRNKIYDVPEGVTILKEGEINLDMYKIVEGHVEMYTGYGTDDEVLIGMLGPGTCFGEFGILTGRPAIYTIITYSDTKILRVTEGLMGDFIQENHDSILQIMKNMANNMMRMQHQITQLSHELAELSSDGTGDDSEGIILKDNLRSYALYDPEHPNKYMQGKMNFLNRKNQKDN